jgi:AcrR family transcriptional regulator
MASVSDKSKSPKAERQHRRSPAELRTLLLDAARAEFGANGYANTTNRDVARRAGVALSVLYRHFETKAELPAPMIVRIRIAFEKLITQLRLMTELEARRRGWMSTQGVDMSVRVLLGMIIGMSSYGWILLPDDHAESGSDDVVEGMIKLGLWGMTRHRDGLPPPAAADSPAP